MSSASVQVVSSACERIAFTPTFKSNCEQLAVPVPLRTGVVFALSCFYRLSRGRSRRGKRITA